MYLEERPPFPFSHPWGLQQEACHASFGKATGVHLNWVTFLRTACLSQKHLSAREPCCARFRSAYGRRGSTTPKPPRKSPNGMARIVKLAVITGCFFQKRCSPKSGELSARRVRSTASGRYPGARMVIQCSATWQPTGTTPNNHVAGRSENRHAAGPPRPQHRSRKPDILTWCGEGTTCRVGNYRIKAGGHLGGNPETLICNGNCESTTGCFCILSKT